MTRSKERKKKKWSQAIIFHAPNIGKKIKEETEITKVSLKIYQEKEN